METNDETTDLQAGRLRALAASLQAHAAITVKDDDGNTVTAAEAGPARDLAGAARHRTAVRGRRRQPPGGRGLLQRLPEEAAKKIQQVGSNREVDLERIIALKPDLIVVWRHGSSERQIDMVRSSACRCSTASRKSSKTSPTTSQAGPADGHRRKSPRRPRPTCAARWPPARALRQPPVVRSFYQVWDKPLYTLNGKHIVSDALRLCGGENIFAKLAVTAPVVSASKACCRRIRKRSSRPPKRTTAASDLWKPYPTLLAVRNDNLFTIDGNLLNRAGPRMIAGAEQLCEKLELARSTASK
jgi:iron complex transport system substrate-binding protein